MEQQKQQMEQQMLSTVMPNSTGLMPPGNQQQQQPQQQTAIPSLMGQKITMPSMNEQQESSYGNTQQQGHTNPNNAQCFPNNASSGNNNFFIPDLSKPPPGFLNPATGSGGATAAVGTAANNSQIPSLLQQPPFAQINSNIPQNQSMVSPTSNINAGDLLNNVPNINVDLRNISAALQMVQQQQQQNSTPFDNQTIQSHSIAGVADDDLQSNVQQLVPMEPEEDQKPSAAYYDLPAGLMVPLIRLEDYNYKPLDPQDIRLPPPAPQTERLTNALAAFYALPTRDMPRDKYVLKKTPSEHREKDSNIYLYFSEGWEKLGLYEYYKVKNAARKQKEEDIRNGIREKSRSPSPIVREKPKPKKINKRCYR